MPTLSALREQYRDYLRHERMSAPQTITAYMSDLNRLINDVGDIEPDAIELDALRAHIRTMHKAGLSVGTIRRRMHSINTLFNWFVLCGMIQESPSKKLRIPRRAKTEPRYLTEAELKRFAETPSPHRAAWLLLAYLGLRRAELLALRWEDVNLTDQVITVRNGKGKKDRILPIPEALRQALEEARAEQHPQQADRVTGLSKDQLMRAFYVHLEAAAIETPGITPHSLRHSFATHLTRAGVHITNMKELMGHQDIATTMRYIHHSPDTLRAAIDKHPLSK